MNGLFNRTTKGGICMLFWLVMIDSVLHWTIEWNHYDDCFFEYIYYVLKGIWNRSATDRKCDGTIFIPLLIKNCLFIGMQINPCLPLKQMYMLFLLSTEDNKPHISRRVSIYRNSTALRCISLVSNLSIGWRWFPHNVRWSTIYATGSGCLSSSVFMCSTNIFYL